MADPARFPLLDMCWVLDGKRPVSATSLEQWVEFLDDDERVVRQTAIGDTEVSTVFLAFGGTLFHFLQEEAPRRLFETMIFGGARDHEQIRYDTWDEALAGHIKVVEELAHA